MKNSAMKKGKYGNERVLYKDMWFDSKKERDRYIQLEEIQAQGLISNLQRQVQIEIQPHFKDARTGKMIRAINYYADFVYEQDGQTIVEDVKSKATSKDAVYNLKKKLLAYKGIYIKEEI